MHFIFLINSGWPYTKTMFRPRSTMVCVGPLSTMVDHGQSHYPGRPYTKTMFRPRLTMVCGTIVNHGRPWSTTLSRAAIYQDHVLTMVDHGLRTMVETCLTMVMSDCGSWMTTVILATTVNHVHKVAIYRGMNHGRPRSNHGQNTVNHVS